MMTKEEILAKSRGENKGRDLAELEVIDRAGRTACIVGLVLCCTVSVMEAILAGRFHYGIWAVYFGMSGTVFLVKYKRLKKRHELALTVLYFILALFFFAGTVLRAAGVL